MAPVSARVPVPALVMPVAVVPLAMIPPRVSVAAPLVVRVRVVPAEEPRFAAPVPRFRLLEPAKVKSPLMLRNERPVAVRADPLVLSSVPLVIFRLPPRLLLPSPAPAIAPAAL